MLRGAARSRLHVARFARSARLPARSLSSSTPPPPPPPDKTPDKPEVPDSTFLFRMTNPELFMDPNKRSNWYIVAGVWAFFAAYIGWTYWRVDLPAQRAKEAAPPPPARVEDEVVRTLPNGRQLLRDGSIRRPG